MAYDRQSKRVYAFEDQWLEWICHDPSLTKAQTLKNVAWACRLYDVPVPEIRHENINGYPHYDPDSHTITFSKTFHNLEVVIHEAAHAVSDWLLGTDGEPHSPEFVGVWIWLLAERGLAPKAALMAGLRETKIRYVEPGRVSPKAIRAHYYRQIEMAEVEREEF